MWICTDPLTGQYGRRLTETRYEFKELDKQRAIIDLSDYSADVIEDCIEEFGYSILPFSKDYILNTYQTKETASWVIAECLYETIENQIK